jgi:tripartite-type tricarboxylate transporter receptor subunit TctC
MIRPPILLLAALPALFAAAAANAQPYPSKPVRIIASFAPGGGVDVMARLVAQELQKGLGQPFVVENRPGASGSIGADAVAKSAPDGYTLLAGGNPELTFMPVVNDKLPYDPQRDLAPLVLGANAPAVVVANPGSGIASMAQLMEQARSPQGVPYGTPGRGTPMHLAFELINVQTGTRFTHVPYKGGGPATNDVVAGQIGVAVINSPPVLPHIRSGKLRALAVLLPERSALLADVPTLKESTGIEGILAPAWFAFSAPAKTPAEIRARLEQEIRRALGVAEVKAKLAGGGLDVVALPAPQMADIIRAETAYNAATIKRLGFKPD